MRGKHGESVGLNDIGSAIQYGRAEIYTRVQENIGASASFNLLITNLHQNDNVAIVMSVTGSVTWRVAAYNNSDHDDDGSEIVNAPCHLGEVEGKPIKVQVNPTVNDDGQQILDQLVPANVVLTAIGASDCTGFIINGGGELLLRFTNIGGSVGDVGVRIVAWAEQ